MARFVPEPIIKLIESGIPEHRIVYQTDYRKRITKLTIRRAGLLSIPNLDGFETLTELNLSFNQISEIKGLEGLTNLSVLYLTANQISEIKGLETLQNLSRLYLYSNQISEIKGLEGLINLSRLSLYSNQISEIKGLEGLTKLSVLYLDANQISRIKGLESLTNLSTLYISLNQISDIKGLHNLRKLKMLDISHNKVKIDSNLLQELYNIYEGEPQFQLRYHEVEASDIPIYASRTWYSLRQHFKSLEGGGEIVKVHALNILLLGNTTAGKSSFLQYYLDSLYNANERTPTFGISHINRTQKIKEDDIDISFWDFGGQEYFHGTHRLFLDVQHSLQLILWQPEYENSKLKNEEGNECFPFRYWLGTIKYFNNRNNIYGRTLLVQSKSDLFNGIPAIVTDLYTDVKGRFALPTQNIFQISVQEAFHNKEERYALLWNLFKIRFEELIHEHKATYEVNSEILKIRQEGLEEIRSNRPLYYEQEDFFKACTKYCTDTDKYKDLILNYLESSGNILRYPNIPKLKNMVFIHPEKLLNHLYDVLSENVQEKGGRFTRKDIKAEGIPDIERDVLLEIMEHMELVFINPQNKEEFIAPQYMQHDNTSEMLKHLRGLLKPSFSLRYPDFMPRAYITQFISRKGGQSVGGVFWKFGVLYNYEESNNQCKVLMEADPNSSFVRVYAEDTPVKYAAAREVFDFFVFHNNDEKEPHNDKGEDQQDFSGLLYLELSEDGINYASIGEILEAIAAKTAKVKSTQGRYMPVSSIFHVLLNQQATMPKKIFFSYAHADKHYRDEFETHFASLKREGLVETWNDAMLPLGSDWDSTITDQLNKADIVLYMLSPSFMASEYIWQKEIQQVINNKGIDIFIPIFAIPCDFENTVLGKIQGGSQDEYLNINWIGLLEEPHRHLQYLQIVKKIRTLI
jgi:internalin A